MALKIHRFHARASEKRKSSAELCFYCPSEAKSRDSSMLAYDQKVCSVCVCVCVCVRTCVRASYAYIACVRVCYACVTVFNDPAMYRNPQSVFRRSISLFRSLRFARSLPWLKIITTPQDLATACCSLSVSAWHQQVMVAFDRGPRAGSHAVTGPVTGRPLTSTVRCPKVSISPSPHNRVYVSTRGGVTVQCNHRTRLRRGPGTKGRGYRAQCSICLCRPMYLFIYLFIYLLM